MSGVNSTRSYHGSVGFFWAIRGNDPVPRLLSHVCPAAEAYGEMLTCPHGHYDLWEEWRQAPLRIESDLRDLVIASEYEEWPRGRVVYSIRDERFVVYADPQVLNCSDVMARVYDTFHLPVDQTRINTDFHYQSTRRI